MRFRLLPLICLLLAVGACQCVERWRPAGMSAEATALFSRTFAEDTGGAFVVDLEGLREAGLLERDRTKTSAAGLVVQAAVPALAVLAKDEPAAGPLLARTAVAMALVREWDVWPEVLRAGLFVPPFIPGADPRALTRRSVFALAVRGDLARNRELLEGLAAIDRAGGAPFLKTDDGDLCLAGDGVVEPMCVRAGDGWFALATPEALRTLMPPAGAPTPAEPPPALVRLRMQFPLLGRAEATLAQVEGLRLALEVETRDQKLAREAERILNDWLAKLDATHAEAKAVLEPALGAVQRGLASDEQAPAALKQRSPVVTAEHVLDPTGAWSQVRRSVSVVRDEGRLNAQATLPAPLVDELVRNSNALVTVAATGAIATAAMPRFSLYRCQMRQADATTVLDAVRNAQRAHFQQFESFGATFEAIGWEPPRDTAYTVCMSGECRGCTKADCVQPHPDDNPCLGMTVADFAADGEAPVVCAVGDTDGDPATLDVWVLNHDGEIFNESTDCF